MLCAGEQLSSCDIIGIALGWWGESITSNCVAVVLALWGPGCVGAAAACSVATL